MKIQSNYSTPSFCSRVVVKDTLNDLGYGTALAVEGAMSELQKIGDTDTIIVVRGSSTRHAGKTTPMFEIGFGKFSSSGGSIEISKPAQTTERPTTPTQVIALARDAFSRTPAGEKETREIVDRLVDSNRSLQRFFISIK
jgi:hypothetical protein